MTENTTAAERLYGLLLSGRWVSGNEMIRVAGNRYGARLYDLKRTRGIEWEKRYVKGSRVPHLAVSGARWFKDKQQEQEEALEFVRRLLDAPIPRIALENPVSVISSRIRKPDQIVQPWMFGHPETKATCWWLKNLPPLEPTNIVPPPYNHTVHREPPGPERWKNRSRTFRGMAEAMADQWGSLAL